MSLGYYSKQFIYSCLVFYLWGKLESVNPACLWRGYHLRVQWASVEKHFARHDVETTIAYSLPLQLCHQVWEWAVLANDKFAWSWKEKMGEGGGESEMVVLARESSVGTWTFVTGMVILSTLANADHNSPSRSLYKAVWSKALLSRQVGRSHVS